VFDILRAKYWSNGRRQPRALEHELARKGAMSNFSDREDRDIVQLALQYEYVQKRAVWAAVAERMKYSKRDPRALRMRPNTLKSTHGKFLREFPLWFFLSPTQVRLLHGTRRDANDAHQAALQRALDVASSGTATFVEASPPTTTVQASTSTMPEQGSPSFTAEQALPSTTAVLASPSQMASTVVERSSRSREYMDNTGLLTAKQSHEAVHQIFSIVRKSDVRQVAGSAATNVGELSAAGVKDFIRSSELSQDDVFLDVGSGIGNVVVQVALESAVKASTGLEIRKDVAALSKKIVLSAQSSFPRLTRTLLIAGDVCELEDRPDPVTTTTVLLANNLLFVPAANHSIDFAANSRTFDSSC
jgi:hypothetical protein